MNAKAFYRPLAFLPGQVRRMKGIPRRALAYLLSQEQSWHISDTLADDIADGNQQPFLEDGDSVALPSEGRSKQ